MRSDHLRAGRDFHSNPEPGDFAPTTRVALWAFATAIRALIEAENTAEIEAAA